jgi:peptidoglycan/xylan/chitin deacetylase (PgdA/CDA1 family)
MAKRGNVFLMYHELELPARALCQSEPGYVRYILPENDFAAQMQSIKEAGRCGIGVGTALREPGRRAVVITFDDGCETDLLAAAPILKQLNFGATFYVTAGFLGRAGYLSVAQLQELAALGFEIGCHSMTHPYLPDLADAELRREIVQAKYDLEQVTGQPVEHFSCPGGQYDQRVLAFAHEAGYRSLANSEIHSNGADTNPFSLGRVAVMRGISLRTFTQICDGRILWKFRVRDAANRTAKRLLGNRSYDRLRALLLGTSSNSLINILSAHDFGYLSEIKYPH